MRNRNLIRRAITMVLASVMVLTLFSGCKKKAENAPQTSETTLGIDVARYQGTIDWQQVADSGVQFAMVRVGYRSIEDGTIHEDVNARYNLQEAAKADIKLGAYFFSTAVNAEEAREEAAWTADLLSGYPITYPVAYDCENFNDPESRQYQMTRAERTDMALEFLKTIEKLGYEGMFYGSKNDMQYDNAWEVSRIEEEYKVWVAQYPEVPYPGTMQSSYPGSHQMWQYDTTGVVPGISQPVDLNVAYFGYDGVNERKDRKAPEEAEPDVEAMMSFKEVDELVTAKDETNLRDIPSQDTDSTVAAVLKNGETAQRIAICPSGWSKVVYQGETYYAVSSYLTTDMAFQPTDAAVAQPDNDGIETVFTPVNQTVTAKDVVNLRAMPSVEHEGAQIMDQLNNGELATCVGISDNGWSKLQFNGKTYYAVSSYLMPAGASAPVEPVTQASDGEGSPAPQEIQTQFEPRNDRVTAKVEVNLRSLPSVEDPDCVVVALLKNGDVAVRTGINQDVGWSRVEYNGQVLYCVSSYLTAAE